jgi:hypothetical protein
VQLCSCAAAHLFQPPQQLVVDGDGLLTICSRGGTKERGHSDAPWLIWLAAGQPLPCPARLAAFPCPTWPPPSLGARLQHLHRHRRLMPGGFIHLQLEQQRQCSALHTCCI